MALLHVDDRNVATELGREYVRESNYHFSRVYLCHLRLTEFQNMEEFNDNR